MIKKYYLDTPIWMDIYEDRKGFRDEPLGDFALRLISMLLARKDTLVLSDLLIKELENDDNEKTAYILLINHVADILALTVAERQKELLYFYLVISSNKLTNEQTDKLTNKLTN